MKLTIRNNNNNSGKNRSNSPIMNNISRRDNNNHNHNDAEDNNKKTKKTGYNNVTTTRNSSSLLQILLICVSLKIGMLYSDFQHQQQQNLLTTTSTSSTTSLSKSSTILDGNNVPTTSSTSTSTSTSSGSTTALSESSKSTTTAASTTTSTNALASEYFYDDELFSHKGVINMSGVDWPFVLEECNTTLNEFAAKNLLNTSKLTKLPKRLIYYHIQHHAGTNLWGIARKNGECAPRACSQNHKHCFVSFSESKESHHLLQTPITYVSYEARLPKHFPLPFIDHRNDFYFVTIIRNPFDRMLSTLSHLHAQFQKTKTPTQNERHQISQFWRSFKPTTDDVYIGDNLMVRWLAGIDSSRSTQISQHDIDIAKCRLELFDLVLTDKTINLGIENILCPLREWTNCQGRSSARDRNYSEPFGPNNPILNKERIYLGAWIERHRPSFEIYDYARKLAVDKFTTQLAEHNTKLSSEEKVAIIKEVKELSLRKSYVETLERYTNLTGVPSKKNSNNPAAFYYNTGQGSSVDCKLIQQQYWIRDDRDDDAEDTTTSTNNPIIYDDVPDMFGIQTLSKELKMKAKEQQNQQH